METNNALPKNKGQTLKRIRTGDPAGRDWTRPVRTQTSPLQSPGPRTALAYLAAMIFAEGLLIWVSQTAGITLYGLLILLLIMHSALGAYGTKQRFLLALGLVPLIRVITLSFSQLQFPSLYQYLLVGVPIFIGVILVIRENRLSRIMIGLVARGWPVQILVGLTGIGLGFLEYLILRPDPLVSEFRWQLAWLPALFLLLFGGLLEELIFRGVIQYTALSNLGRLSLLYVPAASIILYLGQRPVLDILFLFGMAWFYGWIVLRSGSILGVTLSHALANVALFLVFPLLLASPQRQIQTASPETLETGELALQKAASITETPVPVIVMESPEILPTTEEPLLTPELTATMTPVPSETESPTEAASPTLDPSPAIEATEIPTVEEPVEETQSCGPPSGWVTYMVRPGDTLSALSRSLGISITQLMEANCLEDASRINAGQIIYVPFLPAVNPPTQMPIPPSPTVPPIEPVPPTVEVPTPIPPEPIPTAVPTNPPPTEAPLPPPPTEIPPPPEPLPPTEISPPTEAPPP